MKRLLALSVGLLLLAPSGAKAATFTNPQQLKTEDFGASDAGPMVPYPSVIDVRGTGFNVARVKVTLNGVAHVTTTEINAVLVGPSGQSVVLLRNVCGGQNTAGTPLTWAFDDSAPAALPTTATCSSGIFQPSWNSMLNPDVGPAGPQPPYGRTMAGLSGGPADGLWRLYAYDNALNGDGAITGGWTLDLVLTGTVPNPRKGCGKRKKGKASAASQKKCKKKRKKR